MGRGMEKCHSPKKKKKERERERNSLFGFLIQYKLRGFFSRELRC